MLYIKVHCFASLWNNHGSQYYYYCYYYSFHSSKSKLRFKELNEFDLGLKGSKGTNVSNVTVECDLLLGIHGSTDDKIFKFAVTSCSILPATEGYSVSSLSLVYFWLFPEIVSCENQNCHLVFSWVIDKPRLVCYVPTWTLADVTIVLLHTGSWRMCQSLNGYTDLSAKTNMFCMFNYIQM